MLLSLGIERVGDDTARNLVARFVRATDGHDRGLGEATTHDGEEFEARHLRHVEVRDNDVWRLPLELQKSLEAMLRGPNVISRGAQQLCGTLENARFIIN